MIKRLLLSFIVLTAAFTKSQVSFCPPGAEWHYSFKSVWYGSYIFPTPVVYYNEKITYAGDTLWDGETVKIIHYPYFYIGSCSNQLDYRTFIKQHGDTIFMNNKYTLNTWQILYNFATPAGGEWVTTIKNPIPGFANNDPTISHTVNVSAVQTVTINGMALKQLNTSVGHITERIGSSGYLFYFNSANCDGSNYDSFLCYGDNALGVYQPTSKPCNYTTVGIQKRQPETELSVYPNPVANILTVQAESFPANSEITLTDLPGREVINFKTVMENSTTTVDMSLLNKGIYFLRFSVDGKQVTVKKIIKE